MDDTFFSRNADEVKRFSDMPKTEQDAQIFQNIVEIKNHMRISTERFEQHHDRICRIEKCQADIKTRHDREDTVKKIVRVFWIFIIGLTGLLAAIFGMGR